MNDIRYKGQRYKVQTKHKRFKWTPLRDKMLLSLYGSGHTYAEVAAALGATCQAIQRRLKVLNALKTVPAFWTPERDALLRARYLHDDNRQLGKKLGCAQNYVADRLTYLGLIRPYGWRATAK